MVVGLFIIIYMFSFLMAYGIIGQKNDWDPGVILIAMLFASIPIFNTIYCIKNYKYLKIKL